MLTYQLDPGSPAPAYRQLMQQVRWYLAAGQLAAGDRLPSIRGMARSLGVNPSTVVRAYGELEHQGLIARRQGLGVFVAEGAAGAPRRERQAVLRERARTLAVEARQMGAGADELLALVREELERLTGDDPANRTDGDDR